MDTLRTVTRVVTAHRQLEGGGFVVRRPVPGPGLAQVDPFLLIDEMGPVDYGPGEALGAPDHPHRGFETVTYALAGEFEHHDSAGHHGTLGPGDVQWMTAGAGVVHREMPSRRIREDGGRVHGFQIWVNLPAAKKFVPPRYREVRADAIPRVHSEDGRVHGRIIAGAVGDVSAALETHAAVVMQDWSLAPGGRFDVPVPADFDALVYVFEGALRVGESGVLVQEGQMAILGAGDDVRLEAEAARAGRALLLAGAPLREPLARHGPFVMNHPHEIREAILDYQAGRMGRSAGPMGG